MVAKARLEARIDPEFYAKVQWAAERQGSSLTGFVVAALQEKVAQVSREALLEELATRDPASDEEAHGRLRLILKALFPEWDGTTPTFPDPVRVHLKSGVDPVAFLVSRGKG
jgi:hypothetical protein